MAQTKVKTILFVCKGNVGRSQFAEALFAKHIPGSFNISSAGMHVTGEDQLCDIENIANVIDAMKKEEGIDISKKFRKQLTQTMIDAADHVIFLLEDESEISEGLWNLHKTSFWRVSDPKGKDLAHHCDTVQQIKKRLFAEQKNF
ncbi:MAG TPA: low molecular weight phosphatase family protein [Candidatus Paceibacterota bacterium]|jgi:protein-tyrosine-phosphatase|nr:low molecular weight phosphatase family protein [Candidatus Paceibacterota bacterium]